ncbi:uncharacterized protein LOC127736904 [Mytilus californianus]|uniref:uncharacterized protein LOC127736904 n=1 Tax=Mytilus californianus TaxID=6549 RepID=UPI00224865FA|nr:uncharacterized protein LOC127736904 [Mytilus californianus]
METYCDPSSENCTCQRNTSHDKNRGICIWLKCRNPQKPEIKKDDESDIYENNGDSNDVAVAQSCVHHQQSVHRCVQETTGYQGPNSKDQYNGNIAGYAESLLVPSGRLTGNPERVQASIGSPDVGTDDVFTGNKNTVVPMRTLGAEINLELSPMIQCDGTSDCEELYKTLTH